MCTPTQLAQSFTPLMPPGFELRMVESGGCNVVHQASGVSLQPNDTRDFRPPTADCKRMWERYFAPGNGTLQALQTVNKQVHPDEPLGSDAAELILKLVKRCADQLSLKATASSTESESPQQRKSSWAVELLAFEETLSSRLLTGELITHACNEAKKARTKYLAHLNLEPDSAEADAHCFAELPPTLANRSDPDARRGMFVETGLCFPVPSVDPARGVHGPALMVRLTCAAVLEYLAAEVIELAGNEAWTARSEVIQPQHVWAAIAKDAELVSVAARAIFTADIVSADIANDVHGVGEVDPFTLFPRTQRLLRARLEEAAWFHRPDQIQAVLERYLTGQTEDSWFLDRFHIRPLGHLGQSWVPRFQLGNESSGMPQWDEGGAIPEPRDVRFHGHSPIGAACADLIDAAGREWRIVIEARRDPDGVLGCARLASTGELIAELKLPDEEDASHVFRVGAAAARVFAHWAPHAAAGRSPPFAHEGAMQGPLKPDNGNHMQPLEEEFGDWTRIRQAAGESEAQAQISAQQAYSEVMRLICVASALCNPLSGRSHTDAAAYSALHPLAVVQLFSRHSAAMR